MTLFVRVFFPLFLKVENRQIALEVDWLKTNFSLSDLWNVVKRNVQIWDSVFLIGVDALFVSWVETFVELPRILDKLKNKLLWPKANCSTFTFRARKSKWQAFISSRKQRTSFVWYNCKSLGWKFCLFKYQLSWVYSYLSIEINTISDQSQKVPKNEEF